jgi:hypothetical protein
MFVSAQVKRRLHTSCGLHMCGLFALDQVNDIALRRIGIAILKHEDFINPVLL